LQRHAQESGRARQHHAVLAGVLAYVPRAQQARARHALAGGLHGVAVEALLAAAASLRLDGDFDAAATALDQAQGALEALGAPDTDERACEVAILRCRLQSDRGDYGRHARQAARVEQLARAGGHDHLVARALRLQSVAARNRGANDEAIECLGAARLLFEAQGDVVGRIRCHSGLGVVFRTVGRPVEAWEELQAALHLAQDHGLMELRASTLYSLAATAQLKGDLELAEKTFRICVGASEAVGAQAGVASCVNALGDLARHRGQHEEAEALYRRAIRLHEAIGSGSGDFPRLNLAILLLQQGRDEEALALLDPLARDLAHRGRRGLLGVVELARAVPWVSRAGGGRWAERLARARDLLTRANLVEPDVAVLGELAAARAEAHPLRAREALTLAAEHWRALGRGRDLARVQAALKSLSG